MEDRIGGKYAKVSNDKVDNTVIHPQLAAAVASMTQSTDRGDTDAARQIAVYEQQTVVQDRIYSDPGNKVVFKADQAASKYKVGRAAGAQSPEISLASDCERKHLIPFGGDITNANDCLKYYDKVVKIYTAQTTDQIQRVNDDILNQR